MARLIEQLLDFARARQGQGIAVETVPADLRDICRPVVQEIEDANPRAKIEMVESGDLRGVWDRDRLAQVVSNLTVNAVQHGMKGKPITVTLEGADPAVARLRIESHGVIQADALPTLFDAYKRAGRRTGEGGGLGLGLFIARELARAHGGDITVSTGKESPVFEVSLPRGARTTETNVVGPE